MENAGVKYHTDLVVTRLLPIVLLNVAMKNYAWSARDLGIDYSVNWPTKQLYLL